MRRWQRIKKFLRKLNQRCPQSNHLAYTTIAKFQVSNRDFWDKPLDFLYKRFSYLHFSWPENGEISQKNFWKEKKKQRQLDHKWAQKDSIQAAGIHASNVTSRISKNLSYLTCLNNEKKSYYAIKYLKPKKEKNNLKDKWQF